MFAHKGEGSFLPKHSQDLSCTNSPRRTISGDVCGRLSSKKSMKKLNTGERKGQDATKITSAPVEVMDPMSLVRNADFDDSTDMDGEKNPNRTNIEDFT